MTAAESTGSRIRRRREELGLLQTDVAKALGLKSTTQVSQWEVGTYRPGAKHLGSLAEILRTTTDFLLNGTTERRLIANVPRGTSAEDPRMADLARDFEVEMIQAGATRFEADHIRQRLTAFWNAPLYEGGNTVGSLTPEEQEREFRLYMEHSLRPWVLQRVAERAKTKRAKK